MGALLPESRKSQPLVAGFKAHVALPCLTLQLWLWFWFWFWLWREDPTPLNTLGSVSSELASSPSFSSDLFGCSAAPILPVSAPAPAAADATWRPVAFTLSSARGHPSSQPLA
ncbi:hypothetical protein HYALB_00006801 [Hymenoscyphus albidus]|uniref:Uncharacterized protein n=1 Tax=Hymenoscyphus albidus TaxID=595503 RepID=A0A9N9LNK0_9HELO|nr:hypothetical protein HYALB_00006801 [Hymenoscyphus albidus]